MRAIRRHDIVLVNERNFDEGPYLAANPDVAAAVAAGIFATGRHHFELYGRHEGRSVRAGPFEDGLDDIRAEKMDKLQPFIRLDMPNIKRGLKLDFLTEALRAETGISDTGLIAGDPYDASTTEMITNLPDGLLLDCGAGRRPIYYSNVVNYEIVDYDSTDVIGVGEFLPFKDCTFDGVLSIAVLEHVRHPFRCAAEICRVLKPGGRLLCGVPFLAPLHGYPHHYYNMTGEGLRALFENELEIERHWVCELPVHALVWTLNAWLTGLTGPAREEFLSLRVSDLVGEWQRHRSRSWVTELSKQTNFELAMATAIIAYKR